MNDQPELITSGDVAKLLGVHINTVRRWEQQGILKSYRQNKLSYRWFKRKDIEHFLSSIGTNDVKILVLKKH